MSTEEGYNLDKFPISELPESYDTQEINHTDPLNVYVSPDSSKVYFESESLEALIGFEFEDVANLLDEKYGTQLRDEESESFEYGNGWAMIEFG
ncbi:MAG: hypothetical protein BRC29_03995 [Nanohaloarchaea archaeon SW_7_43_1]|nr:MAG: hypothetical protein BRC29_03995 [Nanohaloarchaea archaeon SW_7_43_1]